MNVEIGMRLADLRREHGFSQEALANKLGLSRQAVSKWERAESSPDTDNLIALADLYGVSLDELLRMSSEAAEDARFERESRAVTDTADAADTADPGTAAPTPVDGDTSAGESADAARDATRDATDGTADNDANAGAGFSATGDQGEKVHIGPDGVHVVDGEEYVHVSWRDGVHVKSAKDGDVHVGWNGIHVNDPNYVAADYVEKGDGGWSACDDEGNTVSGGFGRDGVNINGTHYDNWHDAHKQWGDEDKRGTWYKFPFWAVVIFAYLLLGFVCDAWAVGLFVFAAIPLYYIIVDSCYKHRPSNIITGCYPVLALTWFLWMACMEGAVHPAWLIFLTVPIVGWAATSLSKWWRSRDTKS